MGSHSHRHYQVNQFPQHDARDYEDGSGCYCGDGNGCLLLLRIEPFNSANVGGSGGAACLIGSGWLAGWSC